MKRYGWALPALLAALAAACSSGDQPTAASSKAQFAISDAVHEGGTQGFYFLPPMVSQPAVTGTFDADIASLNPEVAICDVTTGPDSNCGGSGGTPAVIVFTTTSTPAITVDLNAQQYQVNWDTKGAGFASARTYRVHVTAGEPGARRALGFGDVLLTSTPGQAKQLETGDIIAMPDGRSIPIHFRVEAGIVGSLTVSPATRSVAPGGSVQVTATVSDLHGTPAQGTTVGWALTTVPTTGVADATQPLAPTSGQTLSGGTTSTTLAVASMCGGVATLTATAGGLQSSVEVIIGNCWTTKAPLRIGRYFHGAATVSGMLYAVGGGATNEHPITATVEAYDPTTNTWTARASMPSARVGLGVATINAALYAVGGFDGNAYLATLDAYDPATDTWTAKTAMPTAREVAAVASADGSLYVIGGFTNNGMVSTVEMYDPTTDTWTTKAPLPSARYFLGAAALNGIVYVVGGITPLGTSQSLEAYDPRTDTWSTKAPMPTPRYALGVVVVGGILYAVGGFDATGTTLNTVEAYDPATDTWTVKASMPTQREGLAVAALKGLLYAVGGGSEALLKVEAYQP